MSRKYLLLIIIIIIIGIAGIIIWIHYSSWARGRARVASHYLKDYSSLKLIHPKSFYDNHRAGTFAYLKAVYPTSEKLKDLSSNDLAILYNGLWTWYNCQASFGPTKIVGNKFVGNELQKGDYQTLCWQSLPGCGNKWPILPYVPQGWIYDWNKWIKSDSEKNGFIKGTTLGPQIVYSDSSGNVKDVSGSVPGHTYWYWFNGPNPVWMYQRAIFRYMYNPGDGPLITDIYGKKYNTPVITPGKINDPKLNEKANPPIVNIPKAWWLGVNMGGYLEVTMASEPGLATSPPICWYDGWKGSGTWVYVGKTIVARNKFDAVFKLATEAALTNEGQKKLKEYFNSSDPYKICKNLLTISNNGDGKCLINGPILYDGRQESKTYKQTINYNFCNPDTWNMMSVAGNNSQINMDQGFLQYKNTDWPNWCGKQLDDVLTEFPDECIDKIINGTLYRADREASTMVADEVMFALGLYLGYDSIQIPYSSNGNGRYQYEYLELRGYPSEAVKNRDYSSFMMVVSSKHSPVDYRADFLLSYMPQITEHLSIRDILDPKHGKSSKLELDAQWVDSVRIPTNRMTHHAGQPLAFGESEKSTKLTVSNATWEDGCPIYKGELRSLWEYNITAKNHISNMFTYLSIAFAANGNFCAPDGLKNKVKKDFPYS